MQTIPDTSSQDRPILSARGLTKVYGGFVAIDKLDLDVARGSIHGLIGPNGAGKTTTFNLLTKCVVPTHGAIRFDGADITGASIHAVARRGIGRSFQISAVFPQLTALENVYVALQRRAGKHFQLWRPMSFLKALDARAMELLGAVGLADLAGHTARELSYGRQRALELATTLAMEPTLLMLDEPMAGLAREDIPVIERLIKDVARGRTVLMIEHNLGVVGRICDRITVLHRGRRLAEGSYREINENEAVRAAYIGSGHV